MDKAQSFAMQYGYYDKGKKKACCVGYNAGYKQAEKDLAPKNMRTIKSNLPIDEAIYNEGFNSGVRSAALTWEDVATLITIYEQEVEDGNICRYEDEGAPSLQDASEIILRRFNEIRKK